MNENCKSILCVHVCRESTKTLVTLNATWDLGIAVTVDSPFQVGLLITLCEIE